MGLYVKNGEWLPVRNVWVKISGEWKKAKKIYLKKEEQWRKVWEAMSPVPAGLIVPYKGETIPSGWEQYTSIGDRYIVGAGSSYSIGEMGGNSDVECVSSFCYEAKHDGGKAEGVYYAGGADDPNYEGSEETRSGGHSHSISFSYEPPYVKFTFIRALQNMYYLPKDGVILGYDEQFLDLIELSNEGFIRGGNTYESGGSNSISITSLPGGTHIHRVAKETGGGLMESLHPYIASGAHSHTGTVTITEYIKKALVKAFTAASPFIPPDRCIAFWEDLTPPPGWLLCDGNNGTPDLRDYFLYISSTSGTTTGDNTISVEGSLDSNSWYHYHFDFSSWVENFHIYLPHEGLSWPHSHSVYSIPARMNFIPPFYALAIIMKMEI